MNAPLIECTGATKRFGDVLAVDDVSLQLMPGEIMSILGPSGCGKTSLLRLIAGFETLDHGEIAIRSSTVSSTAHHLPPERRNIGMVFQEYALFPHMTVAQNVAFGLRRMSSTDRHNRTDEALSIAQLTGLEGRYPHELSGGQQQRVALARTIAPQPIAVLLDEPFSNLDAGLRSTVRLDVVSILRSKRIAAIFVTHDREESFAIADRIGVMSNGRLEQVDTPHALYRTPANLRIARLIGDCDFLSGIAHTGTAETCIGSLPYMCANSPIADGADVTIMVRPDDMSIQADAVGTCTVTSAEFRGSETMLVVHTPAGASLRCRQPGYSSLAVGAKVNLTPATPEPFLAFTTA